jgi:precorrin-8X/cobalt-precorrin-8 methylmutase
MPEESSRRADTSASTYIDPGATTKEAYLISKTSRTLAREKIGNKTPEDRVRQRCSIAVGDFAMADLMRFSGNPVPATIAALKSGVPIISDIAKSQEITRSSAGILALRDRIPGSIIVIGNAPSALLVVCDLIKEGIRPAVVIGTPVGFVNAAESKALLRTIDIPSISTEGTRGGTPVAVAATNECITILIGESAQ